MLAGLVLAWRLRERYGERELWSGEWEGVQVSGEGGWRLVGNRAASAWWWVESGGDGGYEGEGGGVML